MSQRKELLRALKDHLRDNDGQLVYWGEKMATPVQAAATTTEIRASETKADQLDHLRNIVIGDCHLCPLGDQRIKLVFGVGDPQAEVLFIGEGPGFEEDRQGEPFVGKAGQLLDKIMGSIGLDRKNAYIANVVKCHPMVDPTQPDKRGNDRAPQPDEMDRCLPFLREQIRIIAPRFIVTLGAVATRALLNRTQGISALRGRFYDFVIDDNLQPIKLLPTFHPAALLRDVNLKKFVWDDMKLLRDALKSENPA